MFSLIIFFNSKKYIPIDLSVKKKMFFKNAKKKKSNAGE